MSSTHGNETFDGSADELGKGYDVNTARDATGSPYKYRKCRGCGVEADANISWSLVTHREGCPAGGSQ